MGRDNQPKARQLARKVHKESRRASYARILIVTEGSKTEPLYLEEIRAVYQLHSANVEVQPGLLGTAPIQVVRYAQQLFEGGDLHKGIRPRSFDQVYAVFDRDDHPSYFDALALAASLGGKLRNDCNERVRFTAIASIPSFELWLLLHYEDIHHPIHRDEVMARLKQHIPGYEKGAGGAFATSRERLEVATQRAQALAAQFNAYTEPEPFTALHELVALLTTLRD
ncbi:RloB family protein [Pseudomonas sp. LjRoot71]|uniref:RloB family protein n=1 Tax=Pseudomonas TaxID=286 RepID=UPI00117DA238|nr:MULTISPECIES: RloB family protein [Pseudomonas]MBO8313459.1 RloB domain-containing protein [Pseudomonas aeruginosa]MBO8328361.1 RloB domain-containing protein [Pseudomonas aeruginosa]MBO8379757.1 RloB domain-containing protein [Pseudomonas aeruginosa]MBO8385302.1 RloB domain-containing protein [Pseudomonas aeruginosa]MBO8393072.1 RloB domain-containing protein [Pseudomonas aeruginosa]